MKSAQAFSFHFPFEFPTFKIGYNTYLLLFCGILGILILFNYRNMCRTNSSATLRRGKKPLKPPQKATTSFLLIVCAMSGLSFRFVYLSQARQAGSVSPVCKASLRCRHRRRRIYLINLSAERGLSNSL